MKTAINNKIYNCNTKAITPIRFRSFFGFSFLNEYTKKSSNLFELSVKLLYIAQNNFELLYSDFQNDCAADVDFMSAALLVQSEMFGYERKKEGAGEDSGDVEYDDFTVLAQMGDCGLPDRLLDELHLYQITEIIRMAYDMRNPEKKPKMLSEKERKGVFGITPEVEEKIRLALERGVDNGE